MNKYGFFRRCSVFVASALCVAMISTSSGYQTKSDRLKQREQVIQTIRDLIDAYFNSKYGSHQQSSADSSVTTGADSVLDVLGVEDPVENEPPGDSKSIVLPTTVTSNPFSGTDGSTSVSTKSQTSSEGSTGTDPVSSTALPYGSVPLIKEDAASIDYLLQKLLVDAKTSAESEGEPTNISPEMLKVYESYAQKLAKTLSNMSPEQQNFVFYGVTK